MKLKTTIGSVALLIILCIWVIAQFEPDRISLPQLQQPLENVGETPTDSADPQNKLATR